MKREVKIMDNKYRRLLSNTLIFTIGNLGSKFIQFLLVPLYTYTLTKEEYGITELILTAINLLIPVFSISIADGLLRFGLDKKLNKGNILKTSLFLVFIGSLLTIFAIPIFSLNQILKNWLIYFILILNLRIYRDVFTIQLKVDDKNKLIAIENILYTFVLCVLSLIFLVQMSLGIKGYFLAYIFSSIFSIIFLLLIGKVGNKLSNAKIEKTMVKNLLIYSIPMILNGIAWWLNNASDRFMIEMYIGSAAVGLYSVAAKLPAFINNFTGVFNQAWIISAVESYEDKEKNFYNEVFEKYYVLLFLSVMLFNTVIKQFVWFYVNIDFFEAWEYTPFLVMSAAVSGVAGFTAGVYSATKKNINVTITTLVGAIVNIILNYFLIPRIGIMGAAIATYISWIVIVIYRLYDISKFSDFTVDKKLFLYLTLLFIQCIFITYYNLLGIVISIFLIVYFIIKEKKVVFSFIKRGGS